MTHTDRIWSPYQQAVFAAVEDPARRHLVVEALAGSGKSTTIEEAVGRTRAAQRVLVTAFNKSIADALRPRMPEGVAVSTLHSFGLRALTQAQGRRTINARAWDPMLKELCEALPYTVRFECRKAIGKLIGLAKGCLIHGVDALDELADCYGIDVPRGADRATMIRIAAQAMARQREITQGPIDFDDMIWLPVVRDVKIPSFDFVFVDETQDLNAAQLELIVRAAGTAGRIVAVGDRRQAIYGFRGAHANAIPEMIDRLNAEVLPLSISYRCPASVIEQARALVPSIEAAPGAASGEVRNATTQELERDAGPGDFVISRVNAPLISLAWRWIAAGRRAEIKGRDIGAGLTTWIKGTNASRVEELGACIRSWHEAETRRLIAAERDTQSVDDKRDCLEALSEGCAGISEVLAKIDRIFGDGAQSGGILLTSTHRAKGLEADRVWLLRDTYCTRPGAEEQNLLYVAITRSKRELIYVRKDET